MTDRLDLNDDDRLLDLLGQVLSDSEPVPDRLRAYARALIELGDLDRELAQLTYDSETARELTGVRGESDAPDRMLVYTSDALSIELLITAAGELRGQLVPPQRRTVVLVASGGAESLTSDADGSFRAQRPDGEFRIWVEVEDGNVETPSISI
jgi:hypothetical protein